MATESRLSSRFLIPADRSVRRDAARIGTVRWRGTRAFAYCVLSILIAPVWTEAQGRQEFVEALVEFSNAVSEARGDEGPVIARALDGMSEQLATWDALIADIEARFASDSRAAPPPAAARMRAALGTVYLDRGRLADALEQFEAAAVLDSELADVHRLRAITLELLDRPQDAASAYASLWEKDPRPAHAYPFIRTGGAPTDGAFDAPPFRALLAAVEAGVGSSDGQLFATVSLLEEETLSTPVFLPAPYAEGVRLIRTPDYQGAVRAFRGAVRDDPLLNDPALQGERVREAIAAWRRGDLPLATRMLSEVTQQVNSGPVHRVLGMAHAEAMRRAEAAETLRRALALGPRDERAWLTLADVLVGSGDLAGARDVLAQAVQAIPMSGLAHWKLGQLHTRLGDQAAALRAFEAAAALPALAGAAHVQAAVGRLQHTALDLDAAARAYERRIRLTPNDSAAHIDLGHVYRAQGRNDDATVEFLVAALLDPSKAETFASIGQMLASLGRDDDAVPMLRRAIDLDGGQLEARYALSRALLRLGRADEARQELAAYQQLHEKAMEEERRRFKDNQMKIRELLGALPEDAVQ